MADFLTRVIIEDGTFEDERAVHAAMVNFHFADQICSRFGVFYRLPLGTYYSQSFDMSADDVRNLALVASRCVNRVADVITVTGEISFFLRPAKGGSGDTGGLA